MNIPLLLKVKQQILDHPETLAMDQWVTECQTAACICGHAAYLTGFEFEPRPTASRWDESHRLQAKVSAAGEVALGLDLGCQLFDVENWPRGLRADHDEAHTSAGRARAVANAIDTFIAARLHDAEWRD